MLITRLTAGVLGLAVALSACNPATQEEAAAGEEAAAAAEAMAENPCANPCAAQDPIASAMSAGPSSVSANARILDWSMNELRPGTNGWTCLPDRPDTEGNDPWCVTEAWMNFLGAYVNQTEPTYTEIGFAYMLQSDSPVSNTDPYATEPTTPEDWVTGLGAHMMLLVPDRSLLEGISTDPRNGGPWIMWPETPYAHIMIPIDSYGG